MTVSTSVLSSLIPGARPPRFGRRELVGGLRHYTASNLYAELSLRFSNSWNALTQQITVTPKTNYILTGWVQNDFGTNNGSFGVRAANGVTVVAQTSFGAASTYVPETVKFNSGNNSSVIIFAGFVGQKKKLMLRLDVLLRRSVVEDHSQDQAADTPL
jgi:hypothetical protein